jgi:hypothetical protein
VVDAQDRLEQARARVPAVDAAVGVLRRERAVATGILAAALAFRLFALLIPLAYVLVAGIGLTLGRTGRAAEDQLSDLVVDSIAAVARTSERGRLIALIIGGGATLVAAGGVVEVLRWIHVLAWRLAPRRQRRNWWLVLGLVAGVLVVAGASAATEWARAAASGLGDELTVLLTTTAGVQVVLLVSLFLFSRLAVAATELNATMWERRAQRRRPSAPPP